MTSNKENKMAKIKSVRPWVDTLDEGRVIHLELRQDGDVTDVVAVTADGTTIPGGLLLTLCPTGCRRIADINPDVGFPLDPRGRIQMMDDDLCPAVSQALDTARIRMSDESC